MIIHEVEQNTDEWYKLRLGKFTGSCASDLLMADVRDGKCKKHGKGITKKSNEENKYSCGCDFTYRQAEGYRNLIKRIAYERLYGEAPESWGGNQWTERGHELEPLAIQQWELDNFRKIHRVGFIEKDDWVGCSPDGLIEPKKMIQVKCKIPNTHIDLITTRIIPSDIVKQMQFELFVAERDTNIFYSWHPKLRPVEIPVDKCQVAQMGIISCLAKAKIDVENLINKLEK